MSSQAAYTRAGYPPDWVKVVRRSILRRAQGRCEVCGTEAGRPHPRTGSKVLLQVAHWDHDVSFSVPFNLYAMCQRCHNLHDLWARIRTKHRRKYARLEQDGQLKLPLEEMHERAT